MNAENGEDIAALLIPIIFFAMLSAESLFGTGRPWPRIPWWRVQEILVFVTVGVIDACEAASTWGELA